MKACCLLVLCLCLPSLSPLRRLAAQGESGGAALLTAEAVRSRIATLAHDSMRGRDTPSRELAQAAAWIASAFRRFGLTPGGDAGTFLQSYPLERAQLDTARSFVLAGHSRLAFGSQVLWLVGSQRVARAGGRVVVVTGSPDTRMLAGAGLAGASVVVITATTAQGRLASQAQELLNELLRQRPGAILFVANVADSVWSRYARRQETASLFAPWQDSTVAPVLLLRDAALAPALSAQGVTLDSLRVGRGASVTEVPGISLTVTLARAEVARLAAPNVVGILPGSDPVLRQEYLVYSAHLDHIGVAGSVSGCTARGADSICNGADDNASGSAMVMSLAEAFAAPGARPRRSLVFLIVSGEENGLWGSDWFAAHPRWPPAQFVADLNADDVGRNRPDGLFAVGKHDSNLGETLTRVQAQHPELGFSVVEDLGPLWEGVWYRSDHYSFARRGVPVLFFTTGLHADYHQPSDEADKIDAGKTARIARLLYYLGFELANAQARPRWNPESPRRPAQH